MAGAARTFRTRRAAPDRGLAKLAAVACGLRRGTSEQFYAHGSFGFGELELHAIALPRDARASVTDEALGDDRAVVASVVVDWLVVDRWIRGRIGFETDAVDQHGALLRAMPDLFVSIPFRVDVKTLPFPLLVARGLGSASRLSDFQN